MSIGELQTMPFAAAEAQSVAPAPARRPAIHLAHIDGLRALAALMVYVNHAYGQSWSGIKGEFPTRLPFTWFRASLVTGHFAVTVFIALSGFCLALPVIQNGGLLRGGTKDFFRRRAKRILPPYYAALFLCLALIATIIGEPTGSLWDVPIVIDRTAVVSHLLLVQDFFRTGRINYVFWSIAVEWHIYFLFPVMVWLARRWGVVRMTAIALVVGFSLAWGLQNTRVHRACPHYIGVFALGVLAAYSAYSPEPIFEKIRSFRFHGLVLTLALLGTLACIPLSDLTADHRQYMFYDAGIALFAFSSLILTSTRKTSNVARLFSYKPLVWLGTFSYSLYLIHAPLLQILWQYGTQPLALDNETTFIALMTLGFAVVVLAAYGFFWLFERPFLSSAAKARS